MPIEGLSEEVRLVRRGKIRLGVKQTSSKSDHQYPKKTDYWVVPPEVQAVYGPTPRVLDIMFPVNYPEIVFPQWYKRWGSGTGLVCRGDGKTATLCADNSVIPCLGDGTRTGEPCPHYAALACRRNANLMFQLYKVPGALSVYQWDTTSRNSIRNINTGIQMLRLITQCENHPEGFIALIPLELRVVPMETTKDGQKFIIYVGQLEWPRTIEEILARTGNALPTRFPIFALPSIDDSQPPDDITDPAIVATYAPALVARENEEARLRAEVVGAPSRPVEPSPAAVPNHQNTAPSPAPLSRPVPSAFPPRPASSPTFATGQTAAQTADRSTAPDPATMSDAAVDASLVAMFLKLNWPATRVAKARAKYPDPRVLLRELRKFQQGEGGQAADGPPRLVG